MYKEFNGSAGRVYELLSGLTYVCSFSCFYLMYKLLSSFAEVCLYLGFFLLVMHFVLFGVLNCHKSMRIRERVSGSLMPESLLLHPLPEFELE
ncbi:hypothetical protein MKX01_011721 [Papaver californicum]|nr:hypothetical protein MKX01_011721 [Papaver californicum]